jgi:predicted Rossmann fold flavoprotein
MAAMSATREYDTIIVGGGPAGLFAAIRLAEVVAAGGRAGGGADEGKVGSGRGSPGGTGIGGDAGRGNEAGGGNVGGREGMAAVGGILILEKREKPGRKLLLSGSGKCNITHSGDIEEFLKHYGGGARPESAARFLKPALLNFTNEDLLSWFRERGMEFETEGNGKVFPVCRKASAVLELLVKECERLGVRIKPNRRVLSITKDEAFYLRVAEGEGREEEYSAQTVLLACGGASYPRTGSEGDGYALVKALGHGIVEPRAALSPVIIRDFALGDLAGLSFRGAGLKVNKWGLTPGQKAGKDFLFEGDLLITHEGFSGPLILDASRHMKAGETIELRFVDENTEEFRARLDASLKASPKRLVRGLLAELGLAKSMAERFCDLAGIGASETGSVLPRSKRDELSRMACGYTCVIERIGNLEAAMVTAGGVELSEVNAKTMESRLVPGLYFAGEVLDFDGDTGGYNLQAAFSTGAAQKPKRQ